MPDGAGRILIVDDEPLMLGLLLKTLKDKGHRLDSCEDGKRAIEKLSQKAYDLIITDHSMPRMTGVELIHSLRSSGRRTPIILMTSYTLEELFKPGETFEGVAFLRKPFGITELHAMVRGFTSAAGD